MMIYATLKRKERTCRDHTWGTQISEFHAFSFGSLADLDGRDEGGSRGEPASTE